MRARCSLDVGSTLAWCLFIAQSAVVRLTVVRSMIGYDDDMSAVAAFMVVVVHNFAVMLTLMAMSDYADYVVDSDPGGHVGGVADCV